MQQPLFPEEDLTAELQKQEHTIHTMLTTLNELEILASNEALSTELLYQQAKPILKRLKSLNGAVAKEIDTLFSAGNREEINHYFEREKQQLIATLSEELKHHQELIQKINQEKNADFPTDS